MKGPAHTSEVYFMTKLRADVLGYVRLSATVMEICLLEYDTCSSLDVHRRFGTTYRLQLDAAVLAICFTLLCCLA